MSELTKAPTSLEAISDDILRIHSRLVLINQECETFINKMVGESELKLSEVVPFNDKSPAGSLIKIGNNLEAIFSKLADIDKAMSKLQTLI